MSEYSCNQGYTTYLNFKNIIKLLEKNSLSVQEMVEKTKISLSTVGRITNTLLKNGIIIISSYKIMTENGVKPRRIFKINPQQIIPTVTKK